MGIYEPWREERAAEIVAANQHLDGAALPIFNALQETFGHVPPEAVAMVAHALNISRAEAHGIVSFYHDLRVKPPGKRVIKLCRAEACQSTGGAAVGEFLLASLGIGWGETTPDGAITVDGVYCLGLCAVSPAALVDGEPMGRLDGMSLAEAARA